ncbi:hypothetical protein VspSw1_80 [Vibrio phage VspSw_1]|uniref:Uncharacterized protein n=1 Tax=Vibrio phage VspSw_1 TaxID=2484249 RepID=A0A411BKS3_9CAUD|nr:hypothetical protein HOV08_gp080 [Vibrio phage VspSw_1]QAY02152.1 hypothetical protein VspSw1_80 [Vibrio phage VspSw_1]
MRHNEEWIELVFVDGEVDVHELATDAWEQFEQNRSEVAEIWWVKKEGDELEITAEQLELWATNEESDEDYSGDDMRLDYLPDVGFGI